MKKQILPLMATLLMCSTATYAFDLTSLPSQPTARTSFPVQAKAPKVNADYTYSVSPAPGRVQSLQSFVVTIEGATEVTLGTVGYANAPRIIQPSGSAFYLTNLSCSGNTMTLTANKEFTDEGEYSLLLPTGFYNIDGEAPAEEKSFAYTIGGEDNGIITEQPAGTRVNCYTTFISWFVLNNSLYGTNLEGKPTHYVIGDDGCLYLYNPIILQPFGGVQTGSYIKGEKDGDEYLFKFPQPIASVTGDDGEEQLLYVNYMNIAYDDEGSSYYKVADTNEYRFKILDNGDVEAYPTLNGSGESGNTLIDNVIGYTDADGEWQGFANNGMIYTAFTPNPHDIPENATIQDWTMTYYNESGQQLASDVNVVISGNDVWVKGFSQQYLPDNWAYGTIGEDNVITFDEYLGESTEVGQYVFLKNNDPTSESLKLYTFELTYDPDAKTMTDSLGLVVNPNRRYYYALEYLIYPVLKDATEELTSRVPKAPGAITNYQTMNKTTGYVTMSFTLTNESVDGQTLKTNNLYYQILVPNTDNFEVYTFNADDYSNLTESITDIPYNGNLSGVYDGYDPYRNVYVYTPGYDNLGVRMVYKDETGSYYSDPVFYKAVSFSGIDDVNVKDVTVARWYTIEGVQVNEPTSGINIAVMSDGSVKKVLVK